MPRTPTDHEMQEAAERLGIVEPGQPLPPRLRAKVAKAIQAAEKIEATEQAEAAASSDFVTPVATIHADLITAGLPETAAARVVAAIAPAIWRTSQGAAHARQ
ncbi:hypothetical protein [Rhodococcus tibetensis]|uniref:DUF222 domain-containing protein n=1 Tax=Rhodococcus tibetensis TaxID=2965064 RepID=A0ABT1QCA9_9NOCA|nr:hypothetical protein [Rhodococcus sp. FXJ9.536]MCQ4119886.1 hypothetical protein [Rhodococcus sp. FXJ9.536]